MKDLELNCDYVPRDTLTVADFYNVPYDDHSIYLAQLTEHNGVNSEIKLNREQVKELRTWLEVWLKRTRK